MAETNAAAFMRLGAGLAPTAAVTLPRGCLLAGQAPMLSVTAQRAQGGEQRPGLGAGGWGRRRYQTPVFRPRASRIGQISGVPGLGSVGCAALSSVSGAREGSRVCAISPRTLRGMTLGRGAGIVGCNGERYGRGRRRFRGPGDDPKASDAASSRDGCGFGGPGGVGCCLRQ